MLSRYGSDVLFHGGGTHDATIHHFTIQNGLIGGRLTPKCPTIIQLKVLAIPTECRIIYHAVTSFGI